MVAPAYRAHIAAFYARMFLDEETGSVSSKGGAMATLKNVVPAMEKQMYYM
jgi:eukaryotic translation initiation factor 2C